MNLRVSQRFEQVRGLRGYRHPILMILIRIIDLVFGREAKHTHQLQTIQEGHQDLT